MLKGQTLMKTRSDFLRRVREPGDALLNDPSCWTDALAERSEVASVHSRDRLPHEETLCSLNHRSNSSAEVIDASPPGADGATAR